MFPPMRLVFQCNLFRAALLVLLAWLAGCARLPVAEPLPPGLSVTKSLALPAASAFAWSPDGARVAVARNGLLIWTPASGNLEPLWPQPPTALAWSPDGSRLAAALDSGDVTRLVVLADGGVEHETAIPGTVRSLFWPDGAEILCLATALKTYSFGGNFVLTLHRWQPGGESAAVALHDVSLKPLTLRNWGGILHRTPHPELSPFSDELLYARLHDPPAFSPYLKIVLRHLESGAEREVAVVPVTAGRALWSADGESVVCGDGVSVRSLDPWTGREGESLPLPGYALAASPGGRYLFADGRLYCDGALLATFPAGAAASFSPRGGKLLLHYDKHLFLLSGLEEEAPSALPDATRGKLLLLRKWRSMGLLSPQEYLEQKVRLTKP